MSPPPHEVPAGFLPRNDAADTFNATVGPLYVSDAAPWRLAFRAAPRHCNPMGTVDGGMLLTLADHAMGMAIWRASDEGHRFVTVSLSGDFVAAARSGDWIAAHPEIVRRTRSLVFANAAIVAGEGARLVLTASGIWKRT